MHADQKEILSSNGMVSLLNHIGNLRNAYKTIVTDEVSEILKLISNDLSRLYSIDVNLTIRRDDKFCMKVLCSEAEVKISEFFLTHDKFTSKELLAGILHEIGHVKYFSKHAILKKLIRHYYSFVFSKKGLDCMLGDRDLVVEIIADSYVHKNAFGEHLLGFFAKIIGYMDLQSLCGAKMIGYEKVKKELELRKQFFDFEELPLYLRIF